MQIAAKSRHYPKVSVFVLLYRPEAVSLVDAFDWHESVLNSTLGRYDGNVYENMYEAAKNSPMNKTTVS